MRSFPNSGGSSQSAPFEYGSDGRLEQEEEIVVSSFVPFTRLPNPPRRRLHIPVRWCMRALIKPTHAICGKEKA